ncbi:hypothetical protein J3R83DRAFT_3520 [Lanmaoa asiatica]|nr:hypothetical protein J3R83DRAFT_3520 [Lanmaoa asiatica]
MFKYLTVGVIAAYAVYQSFFADDRDDRPPSPSPSREPPVRQPDEQQHWESIDTSQRDYASLEAHGLRARAKQEGELMAHCLQQSKEAYQRGDHARAKALSELRKRHELKKESLDAEASAIIFTENNQGKSACVVDLHGLYVKEAKTYSDKAIEEARRRGDSEIRLIVGQGTHSDGGISRLRPAIQKDMKMRGVHVKADPKNPGVLIVRLGS